MDWQEALETNGFVLLRNVYSRTDVEKVLHRWNSVADRYSNNPAIFDKNKESIVGARNLLKVWPQVREVVQQSTIRDYLQQKLGPTAGIVRALFFDKPSGNSWALPWHKDYMIAVKAHGHEGVFTSPSTSSDVPQVKAPPGILAEMLTARLHLDDVTDQNGPLRVIPGSHRFYSMEDDEAREPVIVECRAGDVLLMRPLLTHASGRSRSALASHRRILHFECAGYKELPDGYEWHDFVSLV